MAYPISEIYISFAFIFFIILALGIHAYDNNNRWDYVVAAIVSIFWPATVLVYLYYIFIKSRRPKQ